MVKRRRSWPQFGIPIAALCAAYGLVFAMTASRHSKINQNVLAVSDENFSLAGAREELAIVVRHHATGHMAIRDVWMEPVQVVPAGANTAASIPALLSLPPGWRAGDPAAAVVVDRSWAEAWRTDLVAELLATGAAVLDLDVHTARGASSDSAASPPPPLPMDLLPDLFEALRLLRNELGAGPVVALGRGAGGTAALLAGREQIATRYFGANGPRFAASARLDSGCEWSTAAGEALVGWRAAALHYATMLAATDSASPPWKPATALAAASLACASALVPPLPRRERRGP